MTRYPIYVISKGRFDQCLTADFLVADNVPFCLVVEPQERKQYAAKYGDDRIHVLPFSNLGQGSIPARNWVKDHATEQGYARHWILDDNIRQVKRWYKQRRIPCESGPAFCAIEDFIDRYENVALAGMNYSMFAYGSGKGKPPFHLNNHVYSCFLIDNNIPHRWRGRYNEDTDLCLQVLADGWCTVLVNAFLIEKMRTMTMTGGNTDELYKDDGRLKMARSLERLWPNVVKTDRRFQRPQHVVRDRWEKFDTPLKRKAGVDLSKIKPNEYGLRPVAIKPIKSESLKQAIGVAESDK